MAPDRERDLAEAAASSDAPQVEIPSQGFAERILSLQRSAGNRAVGRLLAGAQPRVLARSPWYRGQVAGGERSPPGGAVHDFGDGVYIAATPELGGEYAALRSGSAKDFSRAELLAGDPPEEAFFKTLDLTKDPRWAAHLASPLSELDPDLGTFRDILPPRGPNENYNGVFNSFLNKHGLRLQDYDSIIGEEFVRGGTQVCLRTPRAQQAVLGAMRVVARGMEIPQVRERAAAAAARGGGGGGRGGGGGGPAGRPDPRVRIVLPDAAPVKESAPATAPVAAPTLPPLASTQPRLQRLRTSLAHAGTGVAFGGLMLLGIAAALLRSSFDQRIIDHQLADMAPEIDAAVRAKIPDALDLRADDPEHPVYLRTCLRVAYTTSTDHTEGGLRASDLPVVWLRWVSVGNEPWDFRRSGTEPHFGYRMDWTEYVTSEPLESLIAPALVIPGSEPPQNQGSALEEMHPTF